MANRIFTFTVANYAALVAAVGVVGGDLGYTTDFGYAWNYDAVNGVWRIDGSFKTLAASIGSLVGMQPGDMAYCTDTGQIAFYQKTGSSTFAWGFLS